MITVIPQDWEKQKLHSQRMHIGSQAYQDQGEKSGDLKRLGQTYLPVLEGLPWRQGMAVPHSGDKDTGYGSSGEYSLS